MEKAQPRPVEVVLVGSAHYRTCASCSHGRTMQEMAMGLGKRLDLLFGPRVKFRYVDATTDEINNFPTLAEAIAQRRMPLPVTLIDGEVMFPGMFTPTMIIYYVKRKLSDGGPERRNGHA